MKISIIISTFNRQKSLAEVLESYNHQIFKEFEIIVVDDGSWDGTQDFLKKVKTNYPLYFFYQKNLGPATARNYGVQQAHNEILLFTDDDCLPAHNNFIELHLNKHKEHNFSEQIAVLGLTILHSDVKKTPFVKNYVEKYHLSYNKIQDKENVSTTYFYTSNVSIHKNIFLKATGFSQDFFPHPAYEDTELGLRLNSKFGVKLIYEPAVLVWHKDFGVNFKKYNHTMFKKGVSAVVLAQKVPSLSYKIRIYKTKNKIKKILKNFIYNRLIMFFCVKIVSLLDYFFIPLPEKIYSRILNYYRLQGVKYALKNKKINDK